MYSTRNNSFIPTLFNEIFRNDVLPTRYSSTSTPAINVLENEKAYKVEVAAPGMTKNDFKINIDNDTLVIAMEKTESEENKSAEDKSTAKYLRREFSYSKFQQTFSLPENVQKEGITAQMADGILTINIPKMTLEEKQKAMKYIEIN